MMPIVTSRIQQLFHQLSPARTRLLHGLIDAPLSEILAWPSADVDISKAVTLPAAWYNGCVSQLQRLEGDGIFRNSWQWVGWRQQLKYPGDFFTGQILTNRYLVCMDEAGQLRAFHNVCRHHAMAVASGCGKQQHFQCPYHGWIYGLDGKLLKATRLKGIQDFKASQYALVPIDLDTWGPFIFLHLAGKRQVHHLGSKSTDRVGFVGPTGGVEDWLGDGGQECLAAGLEDELVHVATREYTLQCNWKVFCDNYLDGGYHVPFAHQALNSELDSSSYTHKLHSRLSIQRVHVDESAVTDRYRGGRSPAYIFIYPNLMINRYGPWMDTNLVLPLSPTSCQVRFDWFVDPALAADKAFVDSSCAKSDQVQQEDVWLCEGVQAGLSSEAYDSGRYAPTVESAMFQFHKMVYKDVMGLVK